MFRWRTTMLHCRYRVTSRKRPFPNAPQPSFNSTLLPRPLLICVNVPSVAAICHRVQRVLHVWSNQRSTNRAKNVMCCHFGPRQAVQAWIFRNKRAGVSKIGIAQIAWEQENNHCYEGRRSQTIGNTLQQDCWPPDLNLMSGIRRDLGMV